MQLARTEQFKLNRQENSKFCIPTFWNKTALHNTKSNYIEKISLLDMVFENLNFLNSFIWSRQYSHAISFLCYFSTWPRMTFTLDIYTVQWKSEKNVFIWEFICIFQMKCSFPDWLGIFSQHFHFRHDQPWTPFWHALAKKHTPTVKRLEMPL